MSTSTQGRAREHKVRDALTAHGWTPIMRAAASKGPADLLLGHPVHGGALIQVGTGNKRLGPADRQQFVTAAELIGALAILATVIPRSGIRYWAVTTDVPATWMEWTP